MSFLLSEAQAQHHNHGHHDPQVTSTHIVTPHDMIPRFCANPTIQSVASGAWSSASTWSLGRVPQAGDKVVVSAGTIVTYDVSSNQELECIEIANQGGLSWSTATSTLLKLHNFQVLPGGSMTIGTSSQAIQANAEIVFLDRALEVNGKDPSQYGNGLHAFGTVTMHGRNPGETFIRFAQEPKAGDTSLILTQSPTGWSAGDRLLIPDTRQIPFTKSNVFTSQSEDNLRIASVVGATVNLTSPLQFDHLGPRDANGNLGPIERSMFPHVGNMSRNIVIRSETPKETGKSKFCINDELLSGTNDCVTRGHTMFAAKADMDIRYVAFKDLGRTSTIALDSTTKDAQGTITHIGTNQVGRYSVHLHHLIGPHNHTNTGYQYTFTGNLIEGFMKWGLTIHGASYGMINQNIVYDGLGSAIATEDGNECFNVFEKNFVVHLGAGKQRGVLLSPKRAGIIGTRQTFGIRADGFWFSGMHNYVRDNVVANVAFGYNFNGYYLTQDQKVPNFRGANMHVPGEYTIKTALPLLEATRNEAYGASGQGLWMGWSRGCCTVQTYIEENVFSDFKIWNMQHSGVETYHESRNTFENFILRNDTNISKQSGGGSHRFTRGFNMGNQSYENGESIIRNSDIQGFNIGIRLTPNPIGRLSQPKAFLIEDSLFHNHVNMLAPMPGTSSVEYQIRNVRFRALVMNGITGFRDGSLNLDMDYEFGKHTSFINKGLRTLFYNFNGITDNNFEVFFEEQAPDYPIPPPPVLTSPNAKGCPEPNLTNEQCYIKYGVAIGGGVAPCVQHDGERTCNKARQRAAAVGIEGLLFPIQQSQPPRLFIVDPKPGQGLTSSDLVLTFSLSGNIQPDYTVVAELDSRSPKNVAANSTNRMVFHNLVDGNHRVNVRLLDENDVEILGASSSVSFTVTTSGDFPPKPPEDVRLEIY